MSTLSSYSVQTAKSELEGMLHGTTLNQITSIDLVFNRAARALLLDIDPQETKRTIQTAPIYSGIYDYSGISDLKGTKIIDIRPQVNRQLNDIFLQRYSQQFDVTKDYFSQTQFNIDFDTANKTLRISNPHLNQNILINGATDVTDNGTWSGTATSLRQDTTNPAYAGACLEFNLPASASAYVENSTMSAVDLTNHLNQAQLFLWVYLPTGADFTNLNLRWGSSATDYYSASATTTATGDAFADGWNLIKFDWASATTTGSPTITAINYLRVTFTYNSTAQTAVRLNQIQSALGLIMEIEYYSKYLFRDSVTGAFQENVTDDSNLINLDTDSFNLFLFQLAIHAFQQQNGKDAAVDIATYTQAYAKALTQYNMMYKSETQKPQTTYYYRPNRGYTKYLGRRY